MGRPQGTARDNRRVIDSRGANERPSGRVVEQRIRNRVREYFEVASSYEAQRQYERDAPIAHVPYEVINQWDDWVKHDPREDSHQLEVYSPDEVEALCDYQAALDVACHAVSDNYPPLDEVQSLPEWHQLRQAAGAALAVFARRGKLPEEYEVP